MLNVVTVGHIKEGRVGGGIGGSILASSEEAIDGLNVVNERDNVAGKDEEESNDAQEADYVESNECNCGLLAAAKLGDQARTGTRGHHRR